VADPLSTAQLERLGKRLIAATPPSDADLQVLHELLEARSELLEEAIGRVKDELALDLTSRVKNTGTILEKLRRQGGWTLGSMQDIAGMRIVGDFDRRGQDVAVDALVRVFSDVGRAPKVIDRRTEPMHGYRAVHVIVFPGGAPLEIQVRTSWQHEWAEMFEKLADLVGRGIRYGEPPRPPVSVEQKDVALIVRIAESLIGATVELSRILDGVERRQADDGVIAEEMASWKQVLAGQRKIIDVFASGLSSPDTL
jgi:ppGpp synthetase/RelA/SpoT-type nucleotidyltranferase